MPLRSSSSGGRVEAPRIALVIVLLVGDLFFSGIVFGWAPLLLILTDEGQYSELCEPTGGGRGPCAAQDNRLQLLFALAAVTTNAASLPVGIFLDRLGPAATTALAAAVEITGLVLLGLADSQTWDVFAPAYVLLALGGCLTMMASYPASFLVPQHQTAILAAISCLFDASSAVFLVLYAIRSVFGASRRVIFFGFAVFAVLLYGLMFALWRVNEHALRHATSATSTTSTDPPMASTMTTTKTTTSESQPLLLGASPELSVTTPVSEKAAKQLLKVHYVDYGTLNEADLLATYGDDEIHQLYRSGLIEAKLSEMSVRSQLRTFEFAFILIFASVQVLRTSVYIGTASKVLINYGDEEREFLYTKIFSLILPLGFVFVPAIDYIVERRGLILSLVFTNAIGLVYNVLVLVPVLSVQCVTFAVFTGFRAFLYAVMSAFTAKTFGLKNMGTLMGIIFSAGAIASLLEYPAVSFSNAHASGDLTVVYWICLMGGVALMPLTEFYRRRERVRQRQHRQLLARFGSTLRSPPHPHDQGLSYRRSPCLRDPSVASPIITYVS